MVTYFVIVYHFSLCASVSIEDGITVTQLSKSPMLSKNWNSTDGIVIKFIESESSYWVTFRESGPSINSHEAFDFCEKHGGIVLHRTEEIQAILEFSRNVDSTKMALIHNWNGFQGKFFGDRLFKYTYDKNNCGPIGYDKENTCSEINFPRGDYYPIDCNKKVSPPLSIICTKRNAIGNLKLSCTLECLNDDFQDWNCFIINEFLYIAYNENNLQQIHFIELSKHDYFSQNCLFWTRELHVKIISIQTFWIGDQNLNYHNHKYSSFINQIVNKIKVGHWSGNEMYIRSGNTTYYSFSCPFEISVALEMHYLHPDKYCRSFICNENESRTKARTLYFSFEYNFFPINPLYSQMLYLSLPEGTNCEGKKLYFSIYNGKILEQHFINYSYENKNISPETNIFGRTNNSSVTYPTTIQFIISAQAQRLNGVTLEPQVIEITNNNALTFSKLLTIRARWNQSGTDKTDFHLNKNETNPQYNKYLVLMKPNSLDQSIFEIIYLSFLFIAFFLNILVLFVKFEQGRIPHIHLPHLHPSRISKVKLNMAVTLMIVLDMIYLIMKLNENFFGIIQSNNFTGSKFEKIFEKNHNITKTFDGFTKLNS